MRAISLWQPWASLVVFGYKKLETRHWDTDYRGPLAIHAAKHKAGAIHVQCVRNDRIAYALNRMGHDYFTLPRGVIIGKVELCNTFSIPSTWVTKFCEEHEEESDFGDYRPDRWAWYLEHAIAFHDDEIEPCTGRQGFFQWGAA